MRTNAGMAWVVSAVVTASALAGSSGSARVYEETPGSLEFSGQMIVRPVQGLDAVRDAQARAMLADLTVKFYPEVDEYVVVVPPGRGTARGDGENALHAQLMATGLFQYAVPNWICFPLDTTPNDPQYGAMWHHPVMRSPQGWDISTGDPNYIIAVTDTGIDLTHEDLAPKRVPGFDAYNDQEEVNGGSVADIHGHGTHVAGCATALGNNAKGVAGPNWNSKIMMIRVAIDSSGGAYYDDLMQGARWAIEHGAKTVSASYSGVAYEPLQTTGAYIKSIGGLYFYAAGNDQSNLNWFDWNDVIVVGATDSGENKAWFSAYGPAVDVFAPGDNILSSCWGGGYCAASGTSMATPVANGVASLIWSINPALTPNQVQDLLFTSCKDFGTPGNDSFWGWGRVDVYGAALAAQDTLPSCPADFNGDGFVTGDDFDAYVAEFELGNPAADFNGDGFVSGDDFDAFVLAFEAGC